MEALGIWPSGDFRLEPGDGAVPAIVFYVGAALGHAVSEGGANRGEFTIAGISPKKILASRRFRVEATGQKITVKGKRVICKRGVSVQFPADFG